jgi:hypothetical protein
MLIPTATEEHNHITPKDFHVACKSQYIGSKKQPYRNDFVWSNKNQEMRVTGDSLMSGIKVLNNENQDIQSMEINSVVTHWDGFGELSPSKTLYMTFKISQFFASHQHHGKAPDEIHTLKFIIQNDGSGSVYMNYANYIENILVFHRNMDAFLDDCTASMSMYNHL